MFYIFKLLNSGKIETGKNIAPSKSFEVIWCGESAEAFEVETGLSINNIQGLTKTEGKFIIDETLKESQRVGGLAVATGVALLSFVMGLFPDNSVAERVAMHGYFASSGLISFLSSPSCNPLTQEDFLGVLELTKASTISKRNLSVILGNAAEWLNSVRFIT